ncbi:acetylornithine deacetylase [Marinobacter salicampi]|uniref:acetylornithine deacetylase n=1 Tax=Marinobacter salicampi TaxID=435907 RepID=UPI001A93FA73|nr:acetylornithine deacetylase [Marinobacter salicampi]
MKKLFTVLLVLALVAYAGFKGTVWYLADSRLAQARHVMSGHGVISRQGLGSSVSGQLTLQDVTYQPFRLAQPLEAQTLHFRTGSPVALIMALLEPQDLPGQWQLEADNISLALDAAMIKNWVAPGEARIPALFVPVCGPDHRQQLGTGDLIRMAVTVVSGDALLEQTAEGMHFELNTAQVGSVEINWPGAKLDPTQPGQIIRSGNQPLEVVLRDGGFMRKVAAYCARESGLELEDWATTVTEGFNEALQARGFEPSPQLRALYRRWVTEGGSLEFSLKPDAKGLGLPVRSAGEKTEAPGQDKSVVEEASMTLGYNGARVPDIFLTAVEPESPELPQAALEPVTGDDPEVVAWRSDTVDNARRWLERRVRVTLASGRVVEGRLTGADDRQLEVAREMDGGLVAYPIDSSAVVTFEVWRRSSDQGEPVPEPELGDGQLPEQPDPARLPEEVPDSGSDGNSESPIDPEFPNQE